MSKVIDIVNERIMKQLEEGTIPWQKPWTGVRNGAYSRSTGRPYSLINQMLLGSPGEYLTVKQIMEAGGKLLPDQKPSIVVFWKQVPRKTTNASGEEKTVSYPMLRYYKVYNIDQCEGIAPRYTPENLPRFEPVEEAERLCKSYLERSGCTLEHAKQDRAFYSPHRDEIKLPLQEQFASPDGYYGTLFHEVGHSTGHASRLNRFATDGYNHEAYSREELVAELIAASALNMLGMETDKTIMDSAAYIGSWLKALKDDKRMLVWAASRAEKALGIITEDVEITAAAHDEVPDEADEPVVAAAPAISTKPVAAGAAGNAKAMEKAALRFAKSCVKTMKDRASYAGAVLHEGKQYITNGYILAVYKNPIAGLPQADMATGNPGPSLEGIIGPSRLGIGQPLPTLQSLRDQFKAAKSKSGTKKFIQYTKLGPNYYNSEYLMTAMELAGVTGGDVARYQTVNRPMYIGGKGCEVIVSPVNVKGMPTAEVWRPQLTA